MFETSQRATGIYPGKSKLGYILEGRNRKTFSRATPAKLVNSNTPALQERVCLKPSTRLVALKDLISIRLCSFIIKNPGKDEIII